MNDGFTVFKKQKALIFDLKMGHPVKSLKIYNIFDSIV